MRHAAWLSLALVVASCANPARTTTVRKPGVEPVVTATAALTGKVKLLSDSGGSIISNNGGAIVSNNSGNIISEHGGGIVANNGGGLTGKTKFRVAGVAPVELALADALVEVLDAAGQPVLDAAGKPLTATTDATGTYRFAALPPRNAVLRIKLHDGGLLHGGQLSAMKTPAVTELGIDTAASLGAAYVLDKYVQGSQQALDKLPTADNQQLHDALDAARQLLGRVPSYQPADEVAATEELRAKAPVVDQRLEAIRALLLGQANLGAGRQANKVAIFDPVGLVPLPDGGLMVAEGGAGRIRRVDPAGAISTYADVARGKVKQNFKDTADMARLADGSLLVTTNQTIFKIDPAGAVTVFAGNNEAAKGPLEVPAPKAALRPRRLAVAADGSVYVGEDDWPNDGGPGRLLVIDPAGLIHAVPVDAPGPGKYRGVAAGADGEVYALWQPEGQACDLLRYAADQGTTKVATQLAGPHLGAPDLARTADGTLYVSDPSQRRVLAIGPDGAQRLVAGAGAPVGGELVAPSGLAVQPDGTLLCCDGSTNLIYALDPKGAWGVRAGVDPNLPVDPNAVPINAPAACLFEPSGALLITEAASNSLRRFANGRIETVAGGTEGFEGDGGPATAAKLKLPFGIVKRGKELVVLDQGNGRIRAIAEDGTIRTLVGGPGAHAVFKPGARVPADQAKADGNGLAVDGQGRIYWTTQNNQVMRLAADGLVEVVCGAVHGDTPGEPDYPSFATLLGPPVDVPLAQAFLSDPQGLAFDAHGDLLVADTISGQVHKLVGIDGPDARMVNFAGASTGTWLSQIPDDGTLPADHDAATAVIVMPTGVAVDAAGNVYVGETGTVGIPLLTGLDGGLRQDVTQTLPKTYARVRKVAPDGTITTIAGPGGRFFPDPNAEDALVLPTGLALAPDGRLAILDIGSNLVRILPAGSF
jgi:sugar lactone lactonase YvrE